MAKNRCTMNPPAPGTRIAAGLRPLMSRLRRMFETYRQNKVSRDAFLNLLCLDDMMLDDIGVTRAEVECAARLPLRINASHALAAKAHARRNRDLLAQDDAVVVEHRVAPECAQKPVWSCKTAFSVNSAR